MKKVGDDGYIGANVLYYDSGVLEDIFARMVKDVDHKFGMFDLKPCKEDSVVQVVEDLGRVEHVGTGEAAEGCGGELGKCSAMVRAIVVKDRSICFS